MINSDIYDTFSTLLETKIYRNYKEVILNILLVCTGVRPAFLFEETNFQRFDKNPLKNLYKIVNYINENTSIFLKTKEDNSTFKRVFVYLSEISREEVNKKIYPVDLNIIDNKNSVNDDDKIALFLGFYCSGHDYSNNEIDRIGLSIFVYDKDHKEIELTAEVCEAEKTNLTELKNYSNKLVNKINKIIKEFGYTCEIILKYLYSNITRLQKLREKDLVFIKKHLDDYLNDLVNFYICDETLLEKSITNQKFVNIEETIKNKEEYEKLLSLYEMAINEKFDKYYADIENNDDLYKVAELLLNSDKEFWRNYF
jgi:hypothetical protein